MFKSKSPKESEMLWNLFIRPVNIKTFYDLGGVGGAERIYIITSIFYENHM